MNFYNNMHPYYCGIDLLIVAYLHHSPSPSAALGEGWGEGIKYVQILMQRLIHARILYVCILDQDGKSCMHKEIPADPEKLHALLKAYH